jgi:serralysin
VHISDGGGEYAPIPIDSTGYWSISLGSLSDGSHTFTARAVHSDGNQSEGAHIAVTEANPNATIEGDAAGNSLIAGRGDDRISGLEGNDALVGGPGTNVLDGGPGTDWADYAAAPGPVTVSLPWGTATAQDRTDTLISIENVIGSAFNDQLIGTNGVDNLLEGGAGNDQLFGSKGSDTAIYSNARSGVTVSLPFGTATGGDGNDTLDSIENIVGSAFDDQLIGSNGVDNRVEGGRGNDQLFGFGGNDRLIGGLGNDTLDGGAGQDAFLFDTSPGAGNIDTILNFNVVDDTIELTKAGIFTTLTTSAGNTLAAGEFVIGAAAADPDDHIIYNSAAGALLYDSDGNGAAAAVQLAALTSGLALTNNDFFVV